MNKRWLVLIIIVAAVLRVYALSTGDTMSDEVFYGFRAIGLIDFVESNQTTPFQWFDPHIPAWAHLSFHDHPPLVFWLEHLSFSAFGDTTFALRFPAALFGVLSVLLLYGLGKELYSEEIGLIAAGILAVSVNHIYISRVGLQESFVIFFILFASYCFIKSLRKDAYLAWGGIVFGLGIMAKYTAAICAPIFLTHLICFRRTYMMHRRLWIGVVLAAVIVSPVIVYNVMLYRSVGHFDFQLSYILGQQHPEWQIEPGKEIGSLQDRLANFVPYLINSNSPLFLAVAAFSILGFFVGLYRYAAEVWKRHAYVAIALFWITALLLVIGPSYRFMTMLTPFLVLCVAALAASVRRYMPKQRALFAIILGSFLMFETAYAVNNEILSYPFGAAPWFASKVRYENYNWGYSELDKYLENEFAGKVPALTFGARYAFVQQLQSMALDTSVAQGSTAVPFLIVYGGNFDDSAKIWIMERRVVYHAWPIISFDEYQSLVSANGSKYFEDRGFKNFYFIMSTNMGYSKTVLDSLKRAEVTEIKNPRGDVAFNVYTTAHYGP